MTISGSASNNFGRLVAPHVSGLRRYAVQLTGSRFDGEDLLQETLLRSFKKMHLFEPGTNFGAWTRKIMYRLYLSYFLGQARRAMNMSQVDECIISIPEGQEHAIHLGYVRTSWKSLSREHRFVLEAIAINGASYEEVALAAGVPVGTIRSRLYRAREHLRNLTGLY